MDALNLTRRRFLKMGGVLIVSSTIPHGIAAGSSCVQPVPGRIPLDRIDSFIALSAEGKIMAYNGHVDLGTGVRTALTQIVADELDVKLSAVDLVLGDTRLTPDQGPTIASSTIQLTSVPLRQAAAQVRVLLTSLAAKKLGQPEENLLLADGFVSVKGNPVKRVSYGELVKGQDLCLPLNTKIKLNNRRRYVGTSVPRLDIPAKVTGKSSYVHDLRLPGMLHGRVLRPPYAGAGGNVPWGQSLVSVEVDSVKGLPGVVKVVVIKDFVGVVAEREEQAIAAMRALKVEWKAWKGVPDLSPKGLHATLVAHPKTERVLKRDQGAEQALAQSAHRLDVEYVWPYQAHASIGPSCGVAKVTADLAEIWSGTQNPHDLRGDLEKLLDLKPGQVVVHRLDASGCYGRNGADDVAADAALLSRAVGRPVRVQLMREQEFGWEPKGTGQLIRIRGGLDKNYGVSAYQFRTCYPSNDAETLALLLTGKVANDAEVLKMGDRTAVPPYYVYPNMDIVCEDAAPLVRASWLRGVSALPNVFAHESWIDEAAYMAKADPIAYRLHYIRDERTIRLINAVKKQSNWVDGPRFSKQQADGDIRKGRGFAYARYIHSDFPGMGSGWAAWVCDVSVNTKTGVLKVDKVFVTHDCGFMINPDGVRHQVQGNVVQATSRVLKEYVTFDDASTTVMDWGGYPILHFDELPQVDVQLLSSPDEVSLGAGETGSVPSAAAIANAIFDAAGIRLREVPFTPDRVLNALQAKSK